MTFPGYVKPSEILIDVGVLYGRLSGYGSALLGVGATRGGLTFNPGRELRNVPFDGKMADIEGLDRFIGSSPTLTGNLLDFSRKSLGIFDPGSTSADSGSMARIQPLSNSVFLGADAYIKDLLWIRRMKDSTLIDVIGLARALVSQYEEVGEEKNEVIASVTIAGRVPADATEIEGVPYSRFRATSIDDLDALFPEFWNIAGYTG